jgi:purine-nucleoside phosphorylase
VITVPPFVVLAAVREEFWPLDGVAVGIGAVRAAHGAASALTDCRSAAVIMLGTVGSYPGSGLSIGDIVTARHIHLSDATSALGLGYVPAPPAPLTCDERLRTATQLPSVDVVTTPAITTDPALATLLGTQGAVEHLEAWSMAYAAARAGRPFVGIFGVTNVVGPDAHAQWLEHRAPVEHALREAAAALIAGYAPA